MNRNIADDPAWQRIRWQFYLGFAGITIMLVLAAFLLVKRPRSIDVALLSATLILVALDEDFKSFRRLGHDERRRHADRLRALARVLRRRPRVARNVCAPICGPAVEASPPRDAGYLRRRGDFRRRAGVRRHRFLARHDRRLVRILRNPSDTKAS